MNSHPEAGVPPTKSDRRKQFQFNQRPPAVEVYRECCQISLSGRTNYADFGPAGRVRRFLLSKEGRSKMFVLFQYCFSYGAGGWRGGGGKFFPCSWYFPEIKMKTQCTESNQQAFRRIACTFDFYKIPTTLLPPFLLCRGTQPCQRLRSQHRYQLPSPFHIFSRYFGGSSTPGNMFSWIICICFSTGCGPEELIAVSCYSLGHFCVRSTTWTRTHL